MTALALAVRLSVRDALPFLAPLFYAAQPLPLAILAFVCGLFLASTARPRSGAFVMAAALVGAGVSAASLFLDNALCHEGRSRLVFWNTWYGSLGWERVASRVSELHPDVVAMVESASHEFASADVSLERTFPGFEGHDSGGGMALLTASPARLLWSEARQAGPYARIALHGLTLPTGPLVLGVADLKSRLTLDRETSMRALAKISEEFANVAFLMVGDFNTPHDAGAFEAFAGTLMDATSLRGQGYRATWPALFPFVQIDQVWKNARAPVCALRTKLTSASDHAMVVVELE